MIPVFILTADVNSPSAQLLADRLDTNFDVHIASIDASRALSKKGAEWLRVETILKSRSMPRGVVIVKDSVVTTADPLTISRTLDAASEIYDQFYLCRWQDKCDYKEIRSIPDSSVAMTSCQPPDGVQAIYLSARTVATLLGSQPLPNGEFFAHDESQTLAEELRGLVNDSGFSSGSTTSNLFNYNVLMAQTPRDKRKVVECEYVNHTSRMDEDEDFLVTPAMPASSVRASLEPLKTTIASGTAVFKRYRIGWVIVLLLFFLLVAGLIAYFVMYKDKQ